ncbi:MAG TPA: hypothetical protein DD640_01900 [Clostridiales bacterium]|nr:hypothetical protein [Clostridiales bacterium]
MRKVMKRSVIVLLALSMLLVMMTACDNTPATTGKPAGTTAAGTTAAGTTVAPTETETEREFLKLTIAMWELEKFGEDAWGAEIEEKFNVDIEPLLYTWDDSGQKMELWAATNALPDSFSNYSVADLKNFYKYVNEGIVREIPAEMVAKYPFEQDKFNKCEILQRVSEITGGYYWNPRPETNTGREVVYNGVLYRKDWAETLGFTEEPDNVEELYDLLKAIVTGDPDANGQDDTFGYCGSDGNMYAPFNAFPGHIVEEDGKLIFGYLSDNVVDALKWFRKLFKEGLIHPELGGGDDDFVTGNYGVYNRGCDAIWLYRTLEQKFKEANPNLGDPLDVVGVLGPFAETEGAAPYWNILEQKCGSQYPVTCSDEKLDRFLEIDNYLMGEGYKFCWWGFEGEDYSVGADGTLTKLHEENMRVKYPSMVYQLVPTWDIDWALDMSPAGQPDIPMKYKQLYDSKLDDFNAAYDPATSVIRLDATYYWVDSRDSYSFDGWGRLEAIVKGDGDVQVMFDQLVADAYAAGAQTVLDELNAKFTVD